MKIAFDAYPIASPQLSGVGMHAWQIARNLCAREDLSCELLLYDFLRRRGSAKILRERIPHTPIRQCNLLPYGIYVELWDFLPVLRPDLLFRTGADIYHFFNFVVPPRVKGYVVNTVHDLVYLTYPQTMQKANFRRLHKHLARSCQNSDIIIAVSENGKRELIELMGIDKAKIRVVSNGVDLGRFHSDIPPEEVVAFRQRHGLPADYFLYIGTLEPRKNIPNLLRAYAAGQPRFGGCKLVLAGAKGWEYKEIFKLVEELHLQNEVVFTGYLPSAELAYLYAGAQAFLFPSYYEGFGMPPLEAMACGVPVMTSNRSSLPEVVGDSGILVEPEDLGQMANAMERLLTDTELHQTCRERGIARAGQFTWERSADAVFQIYQELMGERKD